MVNQNFADSPPPADVIDAFHQAPDLGIDFAWKIAAFSLNYFQRYKEFPIAHSTLSTRLLEFPEGDPPPQQSHDLSTCP
jgi:hypothetical protein